jgi:hypothetical protein
MPHTRAKKRRRQREAEAAEHARRLDAMKAELERRDIASAPFTDQIERMVHGLERSMRGYQTIVVARHGGSLRRYLTDCAIRDGRLPTGRAAIPLLRPLNGSWFSESDGENSIDVDLDALAGAVAQACTPLPLPKTYRLRRHKRAQFFERHIKAMADCLKANPNFASNGPNLAPGIRWLDTRNFLTAFVAEYERLPRGRMTDDYSQIPLCDWTPSLGEIDFDALRRAADVPDDAEDALHSRDEPES